MPNHCYQQVHIHGPRFLVKELYDALSDEGNPQFCQVILPMPFEQWLAPNAIWGGYEVSGWYDWRVKNWGTKWDVADVEITQSLLLHDDEPSDDPWTMDASFSFNCWTAWGPPVPVWEKLHALGIEVDAEYQDEGDMFAGAYTCGKDDSWEPEEVLDEEDA